MKLNPEYRMFDANMFIQLRATLEDIAPPDDMELLDLSIGEPQISAGALLTDSVAAHNSNWQFYPKVSGTGAFVDAVRSYIGRRWPAAAVLAKLHTQILPVPGTRQPLALLGGVVRNTKQDAVALVTNPFYHAWRAGALASGAEIIFMDCHQSNNFTPDLSAITPEILDRTTLMYLCSPTNPQGSVMDIEYLRDALILARTHDFLLIMDECYADIWRAGSAPTGMLEAAASLLEGDEDPLRNLVVVNSLSKRSSAAGLRAGFIIGDASVITQYGKIISNGGSIVPAPLLAVAADLYADDSHVEVIRAHYDESFAIAKRRLGIDPPPAGFFLWLKVGDDVAFVRRLMAEEGVRALPGTFMGAPGAGSNPAAGFVRLALVHDHSKIEDAMARIARLWHNDEHKLV